MKTHCATVIASVLVLAGVAVMGPPLSGLKDPPGMRSATPAGYDVMRLKPSGQILSVIGLIECPELEGAQRISKGANARLISADGITMQKFPHHFSFRITASIRKVVLDGPVGSINYPDDPRDLLLKLRFRIRAFHGLEASEIIPESIEMIGMPAEVPYDERVYRVKVSVGNLPVTDRLVIEIRSPEDVVLTHFPFTLL
jgi:hypothetical protein